MKQFYLILLFFISYICFSQNFTDTKGELQISASGTATYTLPIAIPPSIKNVAPVINLCYSSGVRGGIAGQGWSINSISAISRVSTRRDIDGFVDGVDFDSDDKLSLDGQRLIIKTGSYWENGSTYETEYKSNTKIELKIEGAVTYFIITAPDGSRSWYGSKGSGNLQNSVSVNSWYIIHFEDVYGNYVDYNYTNVVYNGTNQLYIDNITFSGNANAGIATQDKITFVYRSAQRIERDYLKGQAVYATKILDNIQVFANNTLSRKYQLTHVTDSTLGYERLLQIQEFNGQSEASNPVYFSYNISSPSTTRTEKTYSNNLNFDKATLAGDFDGDGRLDFVANNQIFKGLFQGDTGNSPINLPFTAQKWQQFIATTLSSGKLNQFQSIVFENNVSNAKEFNIYNLSGTSVLLSYSKSLNTDTVPLVQTAETRKYVNVTTYQGVNNAFVAPTVGVTSEYFEGDFNGDGLSEVFIINRKLKYRKETTFYVLPSGNTDGGYLTQAIIESNGEDLYVVDLNPGSSTVLGSKGFVKLSNSTLNLASGSASENYVMDFNGDGKSDILQIKADKTYAIYSFKQLNVSPWIELEVIGAGTTPDYNLGKLKLFGDYNADGKIDILIPDEDGSGKVLWHTYYANPNPAGGLFFIKESQNIVENWSNSGGAFTTQLHLSNYYALDINGDGKSDLVRVWRNYYKPSWTINDHNTEWRITAFTNNVGKVSGSGFTQSYDSGTFNSNSPDIPIPITSNYKYKGADTELVVVRGHYNKIEYYQFNKNLDTDNRLKSVSSANANIVQTIDYMPMEAIGGGFGSSGTDVYSSSSGGVIYPNIELVRNSSTYLVSKLTATINGVSKYQEFRYRSFISNYDYGTIGFARTTRSSWYLSASDPKIWTTQNNDINLRGAGTVTWTSTVGTTVFDTLPTGLLSTKTNVFSTHINPISKVYNVLLNSQTVVDELSGVKSESTYTYDGLADAANYYGLETKSVSKQYSGSSLQGTTTIDTQYDNNPTGTANSYYIGRPKKINTLTTIYTGDSRNSEVSYTYTGSNLTKTEKKGHNTSYAMVEDMTYDILGNVLTKTVSAPGAPSSIVSRMVTDEYDTTKRFVIKKTDHQGFVSNYTYNSLGQLTYSKNYLGVMDYYNYDNWGKLLNNTHAYGSTIDISTTTVYTKLASGGYKTSTTDNVNGSQISEYDVLGRPVISTIKGMLVNSTISKKVEYDGLGRKTRESEPYFSSPTKWTTYEYDYLMRPITITRPTGRIQTLSYSGLTTTSVDDTKTTTATVDALGNNVQTTDAGGTITYLYYADGQLKESNYEGHKVTVGIDGWGNKSETKDPNAGTYTYSYDAFGQLTTETTPKGQTTMTYDAFGKILKKKVLGDGTDIETDYIYNSFAQLQSETSKKSIGTLIDSFTYGYDTFHKVVSVTESNADFIQTKTIAYDNYGRVLSHTNAVQELGTGLNSSVVSKNSYNAYNGIIDKITDANDVMLWQLITANEKMQSLTESLGNGITITNAYDGNFYYVSQKHSKNSVNILDNTYSFNGIKGTLNNRQNLALGTSETFTYDNLDRLTNWTNPITSTIDSNTYDNRGRITNHNKLGTVSYNANLSTGIYQKTEINLTTEGTSYYSNLPKQTVNYTMFKSPISINESEKGSTTFVYNSHLSRQSMNYGYTYVPGGTSTYSKSKKYTDDGTVEILKTPTTITIRTYVAGNAYDAPLYIDKIKTIASGVVVDKKYYLHRDYLGTIIAISDESGTAVERRQFDAWGNLAKLQQNGVTVVLPTDGTAAGLMMLDRGYTGHEHLAEVGLIQMNGRLYDPVLRSFLMPDNFIQEPGNTQNYNRYAYVLNNPLMYNDPSGEEAITLGVAVIIGVVIAVTSYTLTALLADVPFSVGGLVKSAFIGAASAAVTFGIGSASSALFTNFYSQAAFQAAAHGTFQGGMTALSGGKFWSGFAAGALSSIAASAWSGGDTITDNGDYTMSLTRHTGIGAGSGELGMIAFGTVSGGAGALLTKGNFWQGAVTGLMVSGLNHFAHQIDSEDFDFDQKGRKVTKKSLGITSKDNAETMLEKMLKGMKIGDYIEGSELEFLQKGASMGIENIQRVSATDFKVNRTFLGMSKIDKNATITLKKATIEGNYENKQGKVVHGYASGIKVTTKGLPLQIVEDKPYNGYIINKNQGQIITKGSFLSWDLNKQ